MYKPVVLMMVLAIATGCSLNGFQDDTNTTLNTTNTTRFSECPNTDALSYDNRTNTYIDWRNCMPGSQTSSGCDDQKDLAYEEWVRENCGYNYTVRIAY